jgi:ribose transport system substrate-binding protein
MEKTKGIKNIEKSLWVIVAVAACCAAGVLAAEPRRGASRPATQPASRPGARKTGIKVPNRGNIGVSLLTKENPFFAEIGDEIIEAASKTGYQVSILDAQADARRQDRQIRRFIADKVVAIVLSPCNSKGVGAAVKEANEAGIPVFTVDIPCIAADAKIVAHIATDNLLGGKLAADAMVEAIGGKGKVAIVDYPQIESVLLRTKGFKDRLAELKKKTKSPGVRIVASTSGRGSRRGGMRVARDILQAHPDVAGFFAINSPSALGVIAALDAGGAGKTAVVGFDGMPEARRAVKDGKLYAIVLTRPGKLGATVAGAIIAHLAGKRVKPQLLVAPKLYRKGDALKDPTLKPKAKPIGRPQTKRPAAPQT